MVTGSQLLRKWPTLLLALLVLQLLLLLESSLIETAVSPDHQEETNTTPQASPSPPTWQVLPDCPLRGSTAAELGGCLLAIGGRVDQMSPL